ncbi:MAG TPA: class I SAM-dependent methyltransferase [Thermoanaerobaculia bacterium]|jgi:pyochelin synthetase|nr:class I SAM-dependent methyltransferase [Thermoanaerobaculia bacterium]
MPPVSVPPLDQRVFTMLGEFPVELFTQRLYRSWELVDRYGQEWAIEVARRLGLEPELLAPRTVAELLANRGFQPGFHHVLHGLLRQLAVLGLVTVDERAGTGEATARFALTGPLPSPPLAELRAASLDNDPANAPALELLDLAGEAYPAVAAGKTSGQEALFGLGQTRLWLSYFSNDNPTYAINNTLASIAAIHRLPRGPLRVLEVGGGGGSGSEALLQALAAAGRLGDLVRYRFTEPSPFFRRGAERRLRGAWPQLPLEVAALDIDQPFTAQGGSGEPFELIFGVNVLHVARDLPATLAEVRGALAPGGVLVASEALRKDADEPVPGELVFLLLEGFWDVVLDPELRPSPGFLAPPQWRRLLSGAGFEAVEVVPDHARIRVIYPRFSTGVLCARRPAG